MKRWLFLILALILIGLAATGIRYERKKRAQKLREEGYQVALHQYMAEFTPGMTRKEVESSLHFKEIEFQQMCCIKEPSTLADLTRIGKEDARWFCSQSNIYIAFEFAAVEPHKPWKTLDSDILKSVTIYPWLEGCL
jgi:hypothetical protein